MIYTHNLEIVAFQIGKISIHWYGLMYLLAFLGIFFTLNIRRQRLNFASARLFDIVIWSFIGAIIGGRIGYMFFYQFMLFLKNPLILFYIWKGGMSFHGGLLGVVVAIYIFSRVEKLHFLDIIDFGAPAIPLGLAFGRFGNFINGELWGRPTTAGDWGIIFPLAGDVLPRHPSQLYEMFFEGIVLFIVLWLYSRKMRPRMSVSAMFILLYGLARFGVEFFREPDRHLGYLLGNFLTMGQMLTLPMIFLGFILLFLSHRKYVLKQ